MVMDVSIPEQSLQQTRGNQLQFVLNVLARRWISIVFFTIAASLAFGVFGIVQQDTAVVYEAQTELIVLQSPWDREIFEGIGATPLIPNTPSALLSRVSKRSLSKDVARALVQQDVLDGRQLGGLATEEEYELLALDMYSRLTLEEIPQSHGIRVRGSSTTQEEANRIVELASRVFIESTGKLLRAEQEDTEDFIRRELESVREQLEKAESSEWNLRQEMGFKTHDQVAEEIDAMNQELIQMEATRVEIAAKKEEIEKQLLAKNIALPNDVGEVGEKVLDQLREELAVLYAEEVSLNVNFQPDFEGLTEIQDEIKDKKQAISDVLSQSDAGIAGSGNAWEDRNSLREQYRQLQLEETTLEIRTRTVEKLVQQTSEELPGLAESSLDYERQRREADQLRKQFDTILEKEFEVRRAMKRGPGQVGRTAAVEPLPVNGPGAAEPIMNFIIGAVVGFLVGFGLAVMIEMMDTSIRSIEDVAEYIGLEVIGTIPEIVFGKGKRGRRGTTVAPSDEEQTDACIVTQYDPKSPISEAYRTLRTNFQFATIQLKPKTVLVTSAVPGEGKTTTAVNMAVTMADTGMKVLIVDTDLRRPNAHHALRMQRGPGLADVLRHGVDVNSVIRPTRIKNLWLISSGRVPPNPSELIGSERMQNLLEQLKSTFDLVICDAPSVLVVTDPVVLSTMMDTVALVVSVNNARRETIIRAKQLLSAAKTHVAGVVLNGLEATRRHYYYYYYYYDEGDARAQRRWYHI